MSEGVPLIDIRPDHWEIVRDILKKRVPQYEVWAFGSRAKWNAKPYSDLDLAIITDKPLSLAVSAALADDFSESDLPWKVDVVDWATTSESFREIIQRDKVVVQEGSKRFGMGGEWIETSVGNLLSFANGRSSPERADGLPYPVYGSNGIIGYASEANSDPAAIIIGRVGSYCGSLYQSPQKCWVTDNAIRAVAKNGNDPRFLFYLLGTLALNNRRAGSGQPLLNQDILSSIPTSVPEPTEQRAIAHVLGTLDDKIELNRRRNQTLEAMARALFKDWFVDFGPVRAKMEGRDGQDGLVSGQRHGGRASGPTEPYLPADLWQLFPDRLDDEGKPKGWKMVPLDGIAELVTTSVSPGKLPDTVFEHYSIPAFDAGRMPAMELGESIKSNKYIVDADVVLVSKLNPQTPRVWLPSVATDRAVCSTEFMQFVPRDRKNRPFLYCLMTSEVMQEEVLKHVTGSTGSRQRAQPSQIAKVDVLIPQSDILTAFNHQVASILRAVVDNQRESQTLAQLRDTLLPKLMSGQVRVDTLFNEGVQ